MRKHRETGVTKLTFNFPTERPEGNYRSKLTCKTASTFTEFIITDRDYDIYFTGADCVNGVLTAQPNKHYEIEARYDGFDGIIVNVFSKEDNHVTKEYVDNLVGNIQTLLEAI